VVGLYRDGNSVPYVIKTIAAGNNSPLTAKSARYFNEDYVAIAEGQKVEVMNGSYRSSIIDNTPDLKLINSFETVANVQDLSFSPSGQYILAQSGANFSSYDIERQSLVTSTVDNTGSASSLKWLNNSYFWSDNKGNMNIREFDGSNPRSINDVVVGQDAIMVRNGEYIYSLGKNETGYQLQRVRMVSL
jgi:hypothetical protein